MTESPVERLDWFGDEYDHAYQGVLSVRSVPGTSALVFGVQRSSELVVTDAIDGHVLRRVLLAGRSGNPNPVLSATGRSLWATDYDTVVRVVPQTWQLACSSALQPATDGTAMFVGDPWLSADESFLLVPRPGSGDVAVLDPESLALRMSVALGRQPLTAVALSGGLLSLATGRRARPCTGKRAVNRAGIGAGAETAAGCRRSVDLVSSRWRRFVGFCAPWQLSGSRSRPARGQPCRA